MKETLCSISPECTNSSKVSITIDMPANLLEQVQKAASLEGTDYQSLMTCFVQQGLENSKAGVKRLQFTEHAREILEKHGVKNKAIDEISALFPY